MEGMDDHEEFLSLGLAVVKDYNEKKRRKKRKINESVFPSDSSGETYEEGKIFSLLELREQVMKIDHKIKKCTLSHHEDGKGLHLIHLLLISATLINKNKVASAMENLTELYHNVCLTGDSIQRVASYFADGLVARLLTRKSRFYNTIMKAPTPDEEFLAFTELYKVSPFYQFAHFTANQAILEAFEKEVDTNNRALHVIDFDVSYGFQWPSLLQSLSEKATPNNRIWIKITGLGRSLEELQETGSRLVSFAKSFRDLVFEFHGLVRSSTNIKLVKHKKKKNEALAINLVFHLNSLDSFSEISETLAYVNSLRPTIVTLVEQEGTRDTHNFLSRFVESLHYFAAIFDSLDDCLPLDSAERLRIEANHLGKEIKSAINHDHMRLDQSENKCPRFEKMETWKWRMESHGFLGLEQSTTSIMQAKLLLKMGNHCCPSPACNDGENGFRIFERDEGSGISLGWQERILVTASSWCCV